MTRAQATQILDAVRRGRYVPQHRINAALFACGDLAAIPVPKRVGSTMGRLMNCSKAVAA